MRTHRPNLALAAALVGLLVPAAPARAGRQALTVPLAADHWSREPMGALRLTDGTSLATSAAAVQTRLDAAIQLARWLERGHPTVPEAARTARLLVGEFGHELVSLGLDEAFVAARLDQLADQNPRPPAPIPAPAGAPRAAPLPPDASAAWFRQSMDQHQALESRLAALRRRVSARTLLRPRKQVSP